MATAAGKDGGSIPSLAVLAISAVLAVAKNIRNRSKRLPNLKVAVLAVPYPFPSICE